eukprot:TRINITY_DN2100_c0_g2_i2.p1 TRINITY_DN2100_c0_g2~~TRINITY_DN2100_c0_g2_i2.p1  ORF type:complete len:131 (-),score=38.41 TRINITY_DN2100_c0_g2_i2:118-510(-)
MGTKMSLGIERKPVPSNERGDEEGEVTSRSKKISIQKSPQPTPSEVTATTVENTPARIIPRIERPDEENAFPSFFIPSGGLSMLVQSSEKTNAPKTNQPGNGQKRPATTGKKSNNYLSAMDIEIPEFLLR